MRRIVCILLILTVMLSLCGCSFLPLGSVEKHTFYYRQSEFQYGKENSVIQSEVRDLSGHSGDLFYLITLYLSGPIDENLVSPFPSSARLMSAEQTGTEISITLTDSGTPLSDAELSLACVCLAMTCLELPETELVSIQYRDQNITLDANSAVLFDTSAHPQTNTEASQ